jgi:hypothetical protein
MIVRIKLRHGRKISRSSGKNRHLALGAAALLAPLALMAYVLGIWRLASDVGVAGDFAIGGVFSHWQIWMSAGVALHIAAWMFNRYGRGHELHVPRILTAPFSRSREHSRFDLH